MDIEELEKNLCLVCPVEYKIDYCCSEHPDTGTQNNMGACPLFTRGGLCAGYQDPSITGRNSDTRYSPACMGYFCHMHDNLQVIISDCEEDLSQIFKFLEKDKIEEIFDLLDNY